MSSHGTSDAEALDLYLRGKYIYQRMEVGGLDTAIAHLRAAIARDPSFAAAYVALADALGLYTQIRTDQSIGDLVLESSERRRLLDTAIELDPSNADAYAILGNDLGLAMDFEGSYQRLARAEELNPNGELVLRYLGQYYSCCGWPPEKAIDYMRRGVELDPYNPWALTNLAIAYRDVDQFEQALRTLDRAHELDPSFWVAWWMRDLVLFELGRYEEAVKAARRALELSGGYVDIYADLIVVLVAAGRRAEAEEIFRRVDAPKQHPRWRPAFRAFALAGLGRDAEALDAIEDAIRLRDGFIAPYLDDRVFLPLHDDPRFLRIVAEVGMERRVARLRQRLGAQ